MPQTGGLNGELGQLADNGFRNAGNYGRVVEISSFYPLMARGFMGSEVDS